MNKLFLFLTVFLSVFLISCEVDEISVEKQNAKQNGFFLSYQINKAISPITRSFIDVEEGEDNINSFYILFFDKTTGGTGNFINAIDINPSDKAIGSTGSVEVNYPSNSGLTDSQDYNLLVCANIENYTNGRIQNLEDIISSCYGLTENEVIHTLIEIRGVEEGQSKESEQQDNRQQMKMNNLPMSAKAVKSVNEKTININLDRAVSRFDVFSQAYGYKLISASIWNAYQNTPIWETIFYDFTGLRTERYYGVNANDNGEIVGSLYAFQNYVKEPQQNDKVTTCLIIGLQRDDSDEVEYFRTNINAKSFGQELKRNNVYRTTVKSVSGKGANNERDAYESNENLLEIDINGWTLDDSGNIHYDGENILALPTRVITLSPIGGVYEYDIFTLGEGTLEMTYNNIPGNTSVRLEGKRLIIDAAINNRGFEGGELIFTFADMEGSISVNQQANDVFLELVIEDMSELPIFSTEKGVISPEIKVNSSGKWKAQIYNGSYFSFSSTPQTILEGDPDDSFTVQTQGVNASSSVRHSFIVVTLVDKPEISRLLVATQTSSNQQIINLNGWGTYANLGLGTSHAYVKLYIGQMNANMRYSGYFGQEGTVKIAGFNFKDIGYASNPTIPENTDIYQACYVEISDKHATKIKTWRDESDKHVFFLCMDGYPATIKNLMNAGVLRPGYLAGSNALKKATPRVLHADYSTENNALYQYLLETGPFTQAGGFIQHEDIALVSDYNDINCFLYEWPETFIPILMCPIKKTVSGTTYEQVCVFGIDPTDRYIFCGDTELFGNYTTPSPNYVKSPKSEENMRFLNNIISYMVESSLSGNDFLNQFK